jgi:hypothetical protein
MGTSHEPKPHHCCGYTRTFEGCHFPATKVYNISSREEKSY